MSVPQNTNKHSVEESIVLVAVLFIIGSIGAATIRYAIDQVILVAGPRSGAETIATSLGLMLGGSWIFVGLLVWMLTRDLLKSRNRLMSDRRTFETFLDSAGDGIFAIDRNFLITMWNRQAEEITGHPSAEVIGLPLRDVMVFYRERDRDEDMVFIEEAMLYGKLRHMPEPMYVTRKDGSEVPVGDSAAPIKNALGDVIGCIVVFRDATQERQQKSLRSEFAYASHQLRTPVTKALWSIEAALDKSQPEREDLEIAYAALKSIRKLSNEILEASEVDQKIVHSKGLAVNVSEVCVQSLRNNDVCVKERAVSVQTDIPTDLHIHGDTNLLGRIMDELFCNASLYSRDGGAVTVSARQEDGDAVIQVHDDGIGIPEKEQPLVFTKFFRGNNIDTSRAPGAGLGLYIAKGYVEAMRGRIWFTSAGEGTTFFVRLPAARDKTVATKGQEQ